MWITNLMTQFDFDFLCLQLATWPIVCQTQGLIEPSKVFGNWQLATFVSNSNRMKFASCHLMLQLQQNLIKQLPLKRRLKLCNSATLLHIFIYIYMCVCVHWVKFHANVLCLQMSALLTRWRFKTRCCNQFKIDK